MHDDSLRFDDRQLAAAERLDADLSDLFAGSPPARIDPTALWLASAMRAEVPRPVGRRIGRITAAMARRAWQPVRVAAVALTAILVVQAVGGLVAGEWVAQNVGEPFGAHAFTEGSLALFAAAIAVLAAAIRPAFAPVSVAVGVPLGLALGARGVPEIAEFGLGAALHLSQGALAVALLVAWYRARRYGLGPGDEEDAWGSPPPESTA